MTARVLVVDDLQPNVKLLEAKLTSEYFDVITASDGPTALEYLKTTPPDIVLLDIMMPGLDGFEVCEQIKRDPATMHIPVVMVTALSDSADRVRGLEAGADDFLTKPVNDTALFARVRSLVRLKMLMDEWRLREQTSGQLGVISQEETLTAMDATHARILVVEDNDVDASKFAATLGRDHDEVHIVSNTDEALGILQTESGKDFGLAIVNLRLTDQDVLRFCSHLRAIEQTRHLPILLVAEDDDLARVAKGLDLGVNDYIIKPIDRNELLARTRTQIRRHRFQDRLRANYERSLEMALTDSLTGLYNRRYLTTHLEGLVNRIKSAAKPLSLLIFDIDYFKRVNDTFGHAVGDEVLVELSRRVVHNMRSFDTVARMGGEEFVVIMPDADADTANIIAERLRANVAESPFEVSAQIAHIDVTISVGVSTLDDKAGTSGELLKRADDALYEAKRSGRNKVVAAIGDSFDTVGEGPAPVPHQKETVGGE